MWHDITKLLFDVRALFLFAIVPLTAVVRAWFGYRKVVAVERWRTTRFATALHLVEPAQRAEIITACAFVEEVCAAPPDPSGRAGPAGA